ncbi:hypothetical protein P5757_15715 [Bacillus tropicus]|uniref:hypothetical protein n=1 Tax=Bacillus tropicus TaxID=2026188 RepID=UPI0024059BC2|nr:hypothetical protein [Bacillus tropicus]MDF9554136.1 hypothetical protein [Bacillus tropicus]MDF9590224.1 hypothetical protein [Bacillus tropicus]MDF9645465.1 hypothetical protein [Bacillus tropicus]
MTVYLTTKGQVQQTIREQSLIALQNRLRKDISDKNISYLDIGGTVIFTRHIKDFNIEETT